MSDLASRQQAADANMVYWGSTCTNAVKSVDPDAMTTVGFFTYNAVGKSGPNGLSPSYSYATGGNHPRFPGRPWSLTTYSNVNFADIHLYPLGGSYSMTSDLGSIEWSTTYGPILMGEYGAYKSVYANSTSAAYAMRDTQVQSCSSFNFKGWLFWTYDTIEQPTLYNLMENYGAINGLLAPIVRPNPCSP
jgi:endo-1,4-beta-mannosidase